MKIIVEKDYDAMSMRAAEEMAAVIKSDKKCVLGLATGGTPVGMYKDLIDMYKKGELDFSDVTSVNLDEYRGLNGEHPQSYRYFMNKNLFDHINIDKSKTFVPNGMAEDIQRECLQYDENIEKLGGIDMQLLGIGPNGHIGFNEPGEYLNTKTHLTDLKESTIEANSRFFDNEDEVPRQAITMGLGGIMKAKKILLIASGSNKADVIAALASGKITTEIPATLLQVHPDVTVIVDEKAAEKIKNR